MSDMNTKDFLIGTLIGGIVGASAALLFAPKSGKELREDITEGAATAKDKTYEFTNAAYEKGSDIANTAIDNTKNVAKSVSDQSSQVLIRSKMQRVS